MQLEAIEQNGEILGNLDGIDRCARARACEDNSGCAPRSSLTPLPLSITLASAYTSVPLSTSMRVHACHAGEPVGIPGY